MPVMEKDALRLHYQLEGLAAISVPTLVIAGKQDKATPPEEGKLPVERIPGACYLELDAAHLSNWEVAPVFTERVLGFLLQGA